MRTDFKVYDAMTKQPYCVSPEEALITCAEMMRDHDVGSLLVVENEKVLGIVTEYDIVRKAVASGRVLADMKAKNVMCTEVHTIDPDVELFEAISMMAELSIRHLPVMHDGEFVGLLTAKDILKIEPALFEIMSQTYEIREQETKPIYGDDFSEDVVDYGQEEEDDD
ncbi:MAG: cyclic nucleotide-binding/CBS domain-containing protein [Candidatus Woesearchaeota archaeon]